MYIFLHCIPQNFSKMAWTVYISVRYTYTVHIYQYTDTNISRFPYLTVVVGPHLVEWIGEEGAIP